MTTEATVPTASLKVEKALTMPFQEVTVLDHDFTVYARKTLNEADSILSLSLQPGSYIVSGLSPSGARTKIPITLDAGDDQRVSADTQQESPHEWLEDITARQQLPQSLSNVSRSIVETLGSFSLDTIRAVSPLSSLSLPVGVVSFAAQGLVQDAVDALNKRLNLGSRPKQVTRRPQDVSIRTYHWASESGRWVRSNLIDRAHGDYALDYTRLAFPSRQDVREQSSNKVNLVGAFRKDQPAKFIALPLFADGAQLILSHSGSSTVGTETAMRSEVQTNELSWRLSAVDERIDALVQALNGRGYENSDAVSEEALKIADRALYEKRRDPEAAVVAGLFLLQYRRLDRRAQWVENLANWFPWSPDALVLGAWANILFDTGGEIKVLSKLTKIHAAGPPQFLPARRLLRDLISISMSNDRESELPTATRRLLERLWTRLGREMQHEIAGGPFYSFATEYGTETKT